MISISKAINIVKRETGPIGAERVRLADAVGRVLAEDIIADSDLPPFDRSQMDGFAVRAKDTADAPVDLKIVGESAAGRGWHEKMGSGEAVRIMTGAPLPAGADSVQKVELTREKTRVVVVEQPTERGRYIVRKGSEIRKGTRLFCAGDIVSEKMIAGLASFGYSRLDLGARPRVSILATGSEIVAVNKKPGRDQIRNSNSLMLKALTEQVGGRATLLPQTGDDLAKLKRTIGRAIQIIGKGARKSDILVITGGVSVGKYDLTKAALRELGAEIFFEQVRLKPGKPTVFGLLGKTLLFGLPGNPVSAAVTFYLFVRTAILKMQNASRPDLPTAYAVLTAGAKAARERDTYLPATLGSDKHGQLTATPLRWHGSSDFVGFAKAEALVFVPKGGSLGAGAAARILLL